MAVEIRTISIAGYPIDIAKMETHSLDAEVTDHPVEKGSVISDHVRLNPIEITLECLVSDTPIGVIATDPTRQAGAIEINGESSDTAPTPSEDAYAFLKRIRLAREPVTIETSLDRFENMVLTSLSVPRNATTSGGLTFEVTFKEVVIIENLRVTVRVATPGSGSINKVDLGLGDGKLLHGRRILWRHGQPPGTEPPVGLIVFTEVVVLQEQKTSQGNTIRVVTFTGKNVPLAKYAHESTGVLLTEQELINFRKDLARDGLKRQKQGLSSVGFLDAKNIDSKSRIDKANNLLTNTNKQPGSTADPALFGLFR